MISAELVHEIWFKKVEKKKSYSDYLALYGKDKFPESFDGVLGFYVHDYLFEKIWVDAIDFVKWFKKYNFKAVIQPDFSIWRNDPRACQMWNRYRANWVARFWQEAGIPVIPSLNWSDKNSYDFCCAGLPIGCEVVSLQCRTTGDIEGKKLFISGAVETLKRLEPKKCMIYGGTSHKAWMLHFLPETVEYIWLSNYRDAMKEGVANEKSRNE